MNIAEPAPAKVNLYLHVCGKRADGYHLLDSLVVFTEFGDAITATAASDISLKIDGPFAEGLSAADDNLVLRAARYLAAKRGAKGAALRLTKNLPVASGIGGGSSDAAATLRACATLWGTHTNNLPAAELAAELGADVPVYLARTPTRMEGIGETLSAVPALPPAWLVLVNPRKALSTAPVFKALAGRHSGPAPAMPARFDRVQDLAGYLANCTNDLAMPAMELLPDIADLRSGLAGTAGCLLARPSGSGPTCFGLYGDEASARAAAAQIAARQPVWWVVPTALRVEAG